MGDWRVYTGDNVHEVSAGIVSGNKVRITVDAEDVFQMPVSAGVYGEFVRTEVEGSDILIRLESETDRDELFQDGISLRSMTVMNEQMKEAIEAAFAAPRIAPPPVPVQNVATARGMSSFLTFVVLTYVNLVLIMMNASISFPFSAMVPQYALSMAYIVGEFYLPDSYALVVAVGFVIAAVLTTGYLFLYLMAKKHRWPIWAALILMLIDTAFIVWLFMGDMGGVIIDLLFHGWVILSLVKLLQAGKAKTSADQTSRF